MGEDPLDKVLDDAEEQAEAQEPEDAQEQQEQPTQASQFSDHLRDLFDKMPEAPDQQQIDAWKKRFGSDAVQVTVFGDERAYVYTYVRRDQWRRLEQVMAGLQQRADLDASAQQEKITRATIKQAVLWPELDEEDFDKMPAGVVDSLYTGISQVSCFLEPQQVAALTIQL